eukprot:SAG11_NODE_3763_length_2243_cov_9.527052_2_plen_78_part_00
MSSKKTAKQAKQATKKAAPAAQAQRFEQQRGPDLDLIKLAPGILAVCAAIHNFSGEPLGFTVPLRFVTPHDNQFARC